MQMPKKKLTEASAANQFISIKLQEGIDFWATNYAGLKDAFGEKFRIQDQDAANFDLFLAKIALNTASLKNLFPPEQADRIRRWILKNIEAQPSEFGDARRSKLKYYEYWDYRRNEIEEYEKVYNESIKLGENPINAIASRLLHKWFGGYVADFDFEFNGKKTGTIGPLKALLLTSIVSEGLGWKTIKDNFDLVEG